MSRIDVIIWIPKFGPSNTISPVGLSKMMYQSEKRLIAPNLELEWEIFLYQRIVLALSSKQISIDVLQKHKKPTGDILWYTVYHIHVSESIKSNDPEAKNWSSLQKFCFIEMPIVATLRSLRKNHRNKLRWN